MFQYPSLFHYYIIAISLTNMLMHVTGQPVIGWTISGKNDFFWKVVILSLRVC